MKNTFLTILFVAGAGSLGLLGLPWWMLAPAGMLAGWLFPQNAFRSLLAGFVGGFLLWAALAAYLDWANGSLLSARIGKLFQGLSGNTLILITGLMGGLLGGFSCLSGRWARDIFQDPAKKR